MSKPEILFRCLVCGVSVNADARFCHQCGVSFIDENLLKAIAVEVNDAKKNDWQRNTDDSVKQKHSSELTNTDKTGLENHTDKTTLTETESQNILDEKMVFDLTLYLQNKLSDELPINELIAELPDIKRGSLPEPNELLPLKDEQREDKKKQKNLLTQIEERAFERKILEAVEKTEDREKRKQTAKEKSRILIERTRLRNRLKRAFFHSQNVQNETSTYPYIRFAFLFIILCFLALLLLIYSQILVNSYIP